MPLFLWKIYSMSTHFKPGQWNVICDVCGFKFKSGEVKTRWDGLIVCKDDFEQRHPMDFMRVTDRTTTVPFTRTEQEDIYIEVVTAACNLTTKQPKADQAVADCATVGFIPTL